jgi:outer membrane protein insertion porin family
MGCNFSCSAQWKRVVLLVLLLTGSLVARGAEHAVKAEIHVSGYGIFGNRKLKKSLQLLNDPGKPAQVLDASFIEDAALILISQCHRDGFLAPRIVAQLTLLDGRQVSYEWNHSVREEPLPRPLPVHRAEFVIHKGVLYFYDTLEIEGLTVVPEKTARSFFVETGNLLPIKQTRVFSPDRLERGIASLTEVLNRRGYESAQVLAGQTRQDDRTGSVNVQLAVKEGPKCVFRSIG